MPQLTITIRPSVTDEGVTGEGVTDEGVTDEGVTTEDIPLELASATTRIRHDFVTATEEEKDSRGADAVLQAAQATARRTRLRLTIFCLVGGGAVWSVTIALG